MQTQLRAAVKPAYRAYSNPANDILLVEALVSGFETHGAHRASLVNASGQKVAQANLNGQAFYCISMKYYILLLALWIPFRALGQLPNFYKYYDLGYLNNEVAAKVTNIPGGYAFISPRHCPESPKGCDDIVQIDYEGNIMERDTIIGTSLVMTILYDSTDQTLILGGYDWNENLNEFEPYEVYIVKVTLLGDTVWSHRYNSLYAMDFCRRMIRLPDGGYMMLGNGGHPDSTVMLFLLRTDSLGNLLWAQQYEPDYQGSKAGALFLLPDGNVAFTGLHNFLNNTFYCTHSITKIDLDGNIIWQQYLQNENKNTIIPGAVLNNGDLVTVGYIDTLCAGCHSGTTVFYCFSPDGALKWQRVLLYRGYDFTAFTPTHDGGFIASMYGLWQITPTLQGSGIMKVSADGEVLWERMYELEGQVLGPQVNDVIRAPDNGFVMAANQPIWHGATLSMDAVIIKVDGEGCFYPGNCGMDSLVFVTPAHEAGGPAAAARPGYRVYPNPASGWLQILPPDDPATPAPARAELYDLTGRRARVTELDSAGRLRLDGLPDGLYLLRLFDDGGAAIGACRVQVQR